MSARSKEEMEKVILSVMSASQTKNRHERAECKESRSEQRDLSSG